MPCLPPPLQELPLPPWRKVNAVLSKWFTPADMAVGAAVAAGALQPALVVAAADGQGGDQPGQPEEQQPALPDLAGPEYFAAPALPPAPLPAAEPPRQQQLGALGFMPGPPGSPLEELLPPGEPAEPAPPPRRSPKSGSRSSRGSMGSRGAAAGLAAAADPAPVTAAALAQGAAAQLPPAAAPACQGMHFFEALSLHQAALRRQQGPAQQALDPLPLQQPAPLAAVAAGPTPLPPAAALYSGEAPDARLTDRTNRPRRRLQAAQAAEQREAAAAARLVTQQAAQGMSIYPTAYAAGGSLWAVDEPAAPGAAEGAGAAGQAAGTQVRGVRVGDTAVLLRSRCALLLHFWPAPVASYIEPC